MPDDRIRYYVLFANYDQGLAMRELLCDEGIKNRIAPAPRAIQGELSCGMSLLIESEDIEVARECIARHNAPHHSIASLANQIQARRDKYC